MSDSDPNLGRRLGPFVLEQRLGDHGSVYHGIHVEKRQSVAVRLLRPLVGPEDGAVQEFARELLFLQSLQDSNIVSCYGGGVQDLQPYLATELVRGVSLDCQLKRSGPIPWPTAARIIRQVCAALEFADHRNVLHLRLSPSKILLTDEGWVKVADFRRPRGAIGAGGQHAASGGDLFTDDPADEFFRSLDALYYQAPEQVYGKPPVSPRSDLYALGCILFEMLTGQRPFDGDTRDQLARAHMTAEPPRLATELADCPIWLDALVRQLLEKNPERRPQYASSVSVALQETAERVGAGASASAHAIGMQPSAIRSSDDAEARRLVARKAKPKLQKPIFEQLWFLATCMALLVAVIAWAVWPLGEEALYDRARELMASDDRDDWQVARRDYLEPLLDRYPDGLYAKEAQAYVDQIEMADAEERMNVRAMLGRKPASTEERQYVAAKRFERFGDLATAAEEFDRLANKKDVSENGGAFVLLARRDTGRIRREHKDLPRATDFLASKLDEADRLDEEGHTADAREIWDSILKLYRGREDVEAMFARAQERFLGVNKKPGVGP